MSLMSRLLRSVPLLRAIRSVWGLFFPGTVDYRESRSASGRASGEGSYGRLAMFKAKVINGFVQRNSTPALPFCHVRLTGQRPLPDAYPTRMSTLGDHLRKRRLDLGLLQREVAERLGVTATTVCNWENARSTPTLRVRPRVIAFLGYDPEESPAGTVGERILAFRRRRGISRRELARRSGVDPSTVARWEREGRRPSKPLLARLESFLAAERTQASSADPPSHL